MRLVTVRLLSPALLLVLASCARERAPAPPPSAPKAEGTSWSAFASGFIEARMRQPYHDKSGEPSKTARR